MTLLAGDGFVLRLLTGADVPMLARWRSDPRVSRWVEGPADEEGVRAKYVANPARAHITHAVAERDGEPVGYVQWYPCPPEYLAAAGLTGEEGVWALDVHLAPERHDAGLGSRLVRLVASHLAATVARRVLIDPEAGNARAVRAYEKAGFRVVRPLPSYSVREGVARDNVLMAWEGEP
ncbi:MAG TPA: GNAT family N-acetyltransferase [Frankiaceae bacterium]|nr:GNAT family N-acetyltransferase [Frankiaceae bacterium]